MPAYGKLYIKDSNGNLSQFIPESSLSTTEYEGATASANGKAGLVPPAFSYQRNSVLRGDGSWFDVNFNKAVALSGSAPNANLSQSNYFIYQYGSNNSIAFTFTYPDTLSPMDSTSFMLLLVNCGNATITWPSSVKWTNGVPPSLSASGNDLLTFTTMNGGTSWFGSAAVFGA